VMENLHGDGEEEDTCLDGGYLVVGRR
jgi:hypothetical protein